MVAEATSDHSPVPAELVALMLIVPRRAGGTSGVVVRGIVGGLGGESTPTCCAVSRDLDRVAGDVRATGGGGGNPGKHDGGPAGGSVEGGLAGGDSGYGGHF